MLLGINLPDMYVKRWIELQQDLGFTDFDTFIINALGVGVRTMDSVRKIDNKSVGEVIPFDSDYYWPSGVDKK